MLLKDILTLRMAFGRENWKGIFRERALLYADPNKKRTDLLLQALGHQSPSGGVGSGPVDTVTYSDTIVNDQKSLTALSSGVKQ